MRNDCSIVRDLLPLYVEDMVSGETREYVEAHLDVCRECKAEYQALKDDCFSEDAEKSGTDGGAAAFKKAVGRIKVQLHSVAYAAIIVFVFLGFSFTGGDKLMYNSLIMPIVGLFGYVVFRWRAVYKMPILLLAVNFTAYFFGVVDIELGAVLPWTAIYSIFVYTGMVIAFLLHYAFRKE